MFNSDCVILPSSYFRLAKKYGLQLVAKERFDSYYEGVKEEGRSLLGKMQALEVRMQDNCSFVLTSVVIYFGGCGGVVVKALWYKLAGRRFDSRWCHWNFSVT